MPTPTFLTIFLVQSWVDAEIQEQAVLDELVQKCESDPHFAQVSATLRASHDLLQGKSRAEIKADPALADHALRATAFRIVATGGPDEARIINYYDKPKAAARTAVEAGPPNWVKYIGQRALGHVWPLLQAEITRLVTTARAETEKNSTGLPAAVVDAHSFFDLCEAFQKNYMVGSEEVETDVWRYGDNKLTRMSLGWRLDKYRPEPKKKEEKTEVKTPAENPTGGPATTAPAP